MAISLAIAGVPLTSLKQKLVCFLLHTMNFSHKRSADTYLHKYDEHKSCYPNVVNKSMAVHQHFAIKHIPYSAKFWWWKILVDLVDLSKLAKIFPAEVINVRHL